MPNPKVDALEIDIVSDSSKAVSAIGKLTGYLYALGDAAKPVASRLNSIANALKRIATAEYEQINGKIESTVKKYKELGNEAKKTSKKVEKAGEEMKDAFSFEGTQKELEGVARAFSKAGLKDISKYYKGLSEKAGLADLEKEREAVDAIADAYAEKGQQELADQIRAAARDPEKLNNLLARQVQLEKELKQAEKEEAKEAAKVAKEAEKQAKQQEKLAAANGKARAAAHKAAGAFAKLLKSLGRVAFYRAIRTALKNVTSAIKEGVTNLYNYSQEFGTAFAPAVDNLRQHLLLLKNAFASALRPVIEAAIPLIIQLVDWLSKLSDKLAQILSVALGKTDENGRYTKAVLGDLEQSNKEAKELRRTLLGFDEINRLDGDTGRGTATSSGANFIQADVEEGNAKIGEWLKNINWDKVWDVLKLAGIVIAAIKGAKLVATLSGVWKALAPIVKGIGSIVAAHPVIAAIVALLIVFAEWGDKISEWFDKAKSKGDRFFDGLNTKFSSLNSLVQILKGTFDFVMDTIGTVASMVYKLVHGDLAGALKDLVHILGNIVVFIIDIVTGVINFILGCVDDTYVFILEVAQWIWNKALQPVFNKIAIFITNVGIWLHNAWIDIKSGVLTAVKWLLEQINKLLLIPLQNKINEAIDLWNTIFGANVAHVNLAINTDALQETINTLQETKLPSVESDVELIPKWEGEIEPLGLRIDPEPAKQWIRDIEKSLGDAIDKATGKFTGKVLEATSEAIRAVNNSTRPNKSFAQYASGGFPSAGSMFIAGESGAGPEWVGDINGRTAVLNSEQMAAAIYAAMNAALANNPQGGGDIYLDGEVIYRNTVRRNNNAVRATGRSALLT